MDKATIETSIPDVFAQQVRRHRERTAIITEHGRVTYHELNTLANRVANALVANGHRHGQTVSILLEQGIYQIASILGVLKTGGIYVPLDSAWDRKRLRAVLRDANPKIVLTDRINQSLATLARAGQQRVLTIDDFLGQYPDDFEPQEISPNDFAYIYYTSGTTGDPKGVVDNHRNILHNIARYTNTLKISRDDRLTLLQSCGFSGAVSNIFASLLNGAQLLPFDIRARGVSALATWLTEVQPTIYHSVPSLFRQLMRKCDTLPTLRFVRLEGDSARSIDVATFNRHFNASCTLANGLGATETGLTAVYLIQHQTAMPGHTVPVGRATCDIFIDVVDAQNKPVIQGELGEIVITSRYLACGYWHRTELTNAVFTTVNGEMRSYRTGDLGRIDPNGLLELLGRVDCLAKIRGEWVDFNALEAAISQCIGVKDAIAAATSTTAADPELVAWVLLESDAQVTPSELRDMLRSRNWPQHATPTRFIVLEQWPLDMNGKVDRKALATCNEPQGKGAKPQTCQEQLVAGVFEQVLIVPSVSRTDDFFDLGGDSLKAVDACLEIGRLTGTSLAFGAIQHASSVAELAQILSGAISQGSLVPLQPHGDGPEVFCVHAHAGHVFNLRHLAIQFFPEQSFLGLQARGLDGTEPPDLTIEAMAATYIDCIIKTQPRGPYLIAGYCFGSNVAIEIARQLGDAGQHVNGLFLIDPQPPEELLRTEQHADFGPRMGRILRRLRNSTPRIVARALRTRLIEVAHKARIRSLSFAVRFLPATNTFARALLRQPADAIAVMQLNYRPMPYSGDACILMPNDRISELSNRRLWTSSVTGQLDFQALAGNARDILREPYARDIAACMLQRIALFRNSNSDH